MSLTRLWPRRLNVQNKCPQGLTTYLVWAEHILFITNSAKEAAFWKHILRASVALYAGTEKGLFYFHQEL